MKNKTQMLNECFRKFVAEHPELQVAGIPILNQIMAGEKATYANIAIKFTIEYMAEEYAMEKKK